MDYQVMRVFLLAVLCAVASGGVAAENGNEVKQGAFPFMAFIYYSDDTIRDKGERFIRSAALISNDWLISSSEVAVAFPQKTLLARVGAVDIDHKFTLNEDDEEQEREVILILRPYNYSATEWWKTDISLLKTLLPFNITSLVAPASLISTLDIILKNCYILVYARRDNETERTLIQINVELLPPAQEHCGNYYNKETMVCAESGKTNTVADPDFCKGNSGGPLMCENVLLGLQTYINDCKGPHLYQTVTGWNRLITCAVEQRYLTPPCADVCVAITKDPPSSTTDIPKESEIVGDVLGDKYNQSSLTESVNNQFNTYATEYSTTSKVETPTATASELDSEYLSTRINEEQGEMITIKTSISKENYSHDTTSYTSTDSNTKEVSIMETTEERDRKNRIEAKHQLVRGEASLNIPSLFHYIMTAIYVLAYT